MKQENKDRLLKMIKMRLGLYRPAVYGNISNAAREIKDPDNIKK